MTIANGLVGPDACKTCHAAEYNEWKTSHHFHAMEPATDSSVRGDFSGVVLKGNGVTAKFFKRNGKYFINTQSQNGTNKDYEVKYTFGYYPLQQYLVAFEGGKMQVPRESYDVVNKKWFQQYSDQKIAADDWLHWTQQAQNWNSMCAVCHSTNVHKNYEPSTGNYHTTFSYVNVTCESCHGQGKQHIAYINSNEYKDGKRKTGSFLDLHKNENNVSQINGCIICHARRTEIGDEKGKTKDALDNFIPQLPDDEVYHADGQFKEEAYEYGSFLQSKMFHRGVKCSNCHNPHTGKPLLAGNALCGQCHETKKYDTPQHTFHAINTDGGKCINCHMPGKNFMEVHYRHDHSLRAPRPDLSVKYGTPNACNNCHKDKTPQWAAEAIVKRYGPNRLYHFAEDLIPGSKLNEESFDHLNRLAGDSSIPFIIRATAINYLGQLNNVNALNTIKKFLTDSNSLVRYESVESLTSYPPRYWANEVKELLADQSRAVRIKAADNLSGLPPSLFDPAQSNSFNQTANELLQFLHYGQDFPSGSLNLADYYFRIHDYTNAEKYFLQTLKIDNKANYARLNLSSIYSETGRNNEALQILKEAMQVDPHNGRICYNLALLYAELKDQAKALDFFERAVKLKFDYDRLYANYGLLLFQSGNKQKAGQVYLEGLKTFPDSETLLYNVCFYYLQTSRKDKAIEYIKRLKEINPDNADYQALYKLI